jgi:pSer/pThr/pTyr-binding forkhead associated (FHA) protein
VSRSRVSWLIGCSQGAIVIDNKSVSRKHLVISVNPVAAGSVTSLNSRSLLSLTDSSKIGTTVDGRKIKEETVTLSKTEHTVQLGSFAQKFRIKWFPVVLTPASSRKSGDPLEAAASKLEQADIKTSAEFIVGQTTHVVASKRNLPK